MNIVQSYIARCVGFICFVQLLITTTACDDDDDDDDEDDDFCLNLTLKLLSD